MRGMIAAGLVGLLASVTWGVTDGDVVKRVIAGGNTAALQPLASGQAGDYGVGFTREGDEYVCDNGSDSSIHRGVMWKIDLDQVSATPVIASAWAKTEQADGSSNSDYSLYLDIAYMDGTYLYGQVATFDVDPEVGWHRREVIVTPEKPIQCVRMYLLFRNRPGKVRFKEPSFGTLSSEGVLRFDDVMIEQVVPPSRGFLLRDVADETGFVAIEREALGVRLTTTEHNAPGVTFYDVTLDELTGQDRAMTLVYTMPQPTGALTWFHHPRRAVALDGTQNEVMNTTRIPVGANGLLSRYPFGAVGAGGNGCAIGLDPATPLFFRTGCQPQTRELFLACDIGFAPEKRSASFRFCVFDFDAANGFRGALARYYALYPSAFATRIRQQGVWMPFAAISAIEDWQGFGFRFKEGDDETAWDDAHDVLTFRYTEPMTWWMTLPDAAPRTLEQGVIEAERLASQGDKAAQAWVSSAFKDEKGRMPGRVMDTPWCNGIVWSMNSAPGIPGVVTDFTNKWNADYIARQYGDLRTADCDGEYVDSAEAYVTDDMNFRRDHFAGMERPLCYALESRKVGIHKGMIGFEYVRALERDIHGRGRYMMANSTPISWFWLAPLLDVMGTEINWNHGGAWSPMSDEELLYRRAMCRGKPYCFLMNSDFDNFPYAATEKYMKRALAYGMFPGFFSADASTGHYFSRPELYNRDRALFKKYVPLCKRVAEAGWDPVTGAVSDNESVILERFGSRSVTCYLTVYNSAATRQTAAVTLTALGVPVSCRELIANTEIAWHEGRVGFELDAGDVRVLEMKADIGTMIEVR